MASRDRRTRCREVAGILLFSFFLSAKRIDALNEEDATPSSEALQQQEWAIMDRFAQAYGSTDWSAVVEFLASNAGYEGNPNIMLIPISLGNVYLNRYESGKDSADFERALQYFAWVADNHWLWGRRWLSAPVVSYLDISLARLRGSCASDRFATRVEEAWMAALSITEEEADARLTAAYPYQPYDSSETGDSKAEENAWEASLLAAAANFIAEHPHAAAWEGKARQLAYDAISRPSDPPDLEGLKTSTVMDDLLLGNHGYFPNPTYAAATIKLLAQAALTYRLSGKPVPTDLQHNVVPLYDVYKSYIDADLQWVVPSDPAGEASLFPFAFDPDLEEREVRCKFDNGYLWQATESVAAMEVGAPLWTAALNSKAVMFYLMGSYLWHFAPACGGVPQGQ